ncbi:hypothetical protein [uncultured Methanobrevibacter sp.]|uniref:hypothetical protein n=1 Tax=uncultured Methanobrevibacter sp. TaxID=253161 RepID=UPI0025F799BD|nr:hypothetical protein [uncultured Methanobrevibacter sp.]MBR4590957.1 hypothetical protein [Bacteroidaceae bacterium]
MPEKQIPEIKQPNKKNIQRINVKNTASGQSYNNDLIFVLNRIANALEERNLQEAKLNKLEEKIKKLKLLETRNLLDGINKNLT